MKRPQKKRALAVALTFLFVLSIFYFAARGEYHRAVEEQKRILLGQIQLVTAQVDRLVNQSIRNALGVIAYVQVNPDLTQAELDEYAAHLIPKDDTIIRHFAILKDTTITMAYPLEGNESAIGVDLAAVDAQREAILQVKEHGRNLLIGPVDLVQGGRGLINRMPIYLSPGTINQTYWGQMALVIQYDPMLVQAGILEFADDYHIKIEQLNNTLEPETVIYSNTDRFPEDALITLIDVPNGTWRITAIYPNGFSGETPNYRMLLFLGVFFATLSAYFVYGILRSNTDLNQLVEERTHRLKEANLQLENSLQELRETQDQLIMREKLAALGELVASVAHEINTPLGICVTLGSYIQQVTEQLSTKFNSNTLLKSDLQRGLTENLESLSVLSKNLQRASELVSSFKQVATDQYLEEHRKINLAAYMEDVLHSVQPKFKGTSHTIEMKIHDNLDLYTSPGAISQVITNLVMNSLIHGFEHMENGRIVIEAQRENNRLCIDYYDNGHGISDELREKIFTPFFTTKKNEGSTGLGMHIVYNIVVHSLKGSLELYPNQPRGVHFHISIPYTLPDFEA